MQRDASRCSIRDDSDKLATTLEIATLLYIQGFSLLVSLATLHVPAGVVAFLP
jgi:hypothetical protein